jgi:trk system potassium uptake protein TrkA
MSQEILIAGGGRVGFRTAELLADRDENVTIVEQDDDRIAKIADAWIATVIQGDASDPDTLEQAGIEDADTIAASTELTGLNLAICLLATRLGDGVRTLARVDRETDGADDRFVDAVVYPESAGARVAANKTAGEEVQALTAVTGNIEIPEVRIGESAPADISFPARACHLRCRRHPNLEAGHGADAGQPTCGGCRTRRRRRAAQTDAWVVVLSPPSSIPPVFPVAPSRPLSTASDRSIAVATPARGASSSSASPIGNRVPRGRQTPSAAVPG